MYNPRKVMPAEEDDIMRANASTTKIKTKRKPKPVGRGEGGRTGRMARGWATTAEYRCVADGRVRRLMTSPAPVLCFFASFYFVM